MATVAPTSDHVNLTMPILDLAPRLRRDVAFSQAAQLLADADRSRDGLPRLLLAGLPPKERDYYKATARALIEVFERMTAGKEPDGVLRQREADTTRKNEILARARESRMSIERSRASIVATERGHDMQPWHASLEEIEAGVNRSKCYRCQRTATITLGDDPVLSGAALIEGCLVAAETETM